MSRFFYSAYCYLKERRKLFFIITFLVFIGFGFMAAKIDFDEDISRFIPKSSENQNLQKVLASTQFNDQIIVIIKKGTKVETADLTGFATRFLDSLNNSSKSYIKDIQGYVDDENVLEILDFAYEYAPLFLNEKDYYNINQKLSLDSIWKITRDNYHSLISPSGLISRDLILKDPLRISIRALQNLSPTGFNEDFILKDGFLVTPDEQNLLLFITPKSKNDSIDPAKQLIKELKSLKTDLQTKNGPDISLEYYGGPIIGEGNAAQIKKDIWLTVGIALSLLMLFFMLFYKNWAIPVILMIPTMSGGLLGVCVLFFLREKVSAISLGIGSILLGVTLDYGLHLLTHIRNGRDIKGLFKDITKPIIMSSLTTALAFLCLFFIDSQALQDLGIFASVSVVGASIFSLLFIPQAYQVPLNKDNRVVATNTFLDKIAAYKFHENKMFISGVAVLLTVSFFTYSKVVFNQDLSKLNYMTDKLLVTQADLDAITNVSDKTLYLSSFGNNFQTALETNDAVYKRLAQLQKENIVTSFTSLSTFLKSRKSQTENFQLWKNFWSAGRVDSTKINLIKAGHEFNLKEDAFQGFFNYLDSDFSVLELETLEEMNNFSLDNLYATKNGFSSITTMVKLNDENIEEVKSSFSGLENMLIIDRQLLNEGLLGSLKSDFNRLILYCSIIVVFLIFVFYRSFKLTVVTVVPILLTWIITIGLMGLCKLEFNIFNIIICSFIFGLGVDYSIFITNGMLNKLQESEMAFATNKTSILLSVLTTIMGIGAMIFAKHPALSSIALISIIGIFSAMIIAFTIQPLLFNLLIKPRNGQN